MESQGINIDPNRLNAPEYRAGYRMEAEKDIRARLVLDKIAQAEGMALDDAETDAIFRDIGRSYGVDPEKIKAEYGDSAMLEQLKGRKLEDKVFDFIENEAVYVDKPEDAEIQAAASQEEGDKNPEQE